jgi:hypothetical protein
VVLKIADRHGWDTVNEYLDDPLADNSEDASKLREAIVRAGRKRKRSGSIRLLNLGLAPSTSGEMRLSSHGIP